MKIHVIIYHCVLFSRKIIKYVYNWLIYTTRCLANAKQNKSFIRKVVILLKTRWRKRWRHRVWWRLPRCCRSWTPPPVVKLPWPLRICRQYWPLWKTDRSGPLYRGSSRPIWGPVYFRSYWPWQEYRWRGAIPTRLSCRTWDKKKLWKKSKLPRVG